MVPSCRGSKSYVPSTELMYDMRRQLLAVTAILLASGGRVVESADMAQRTAKEPPHDRVWVGPMPFDLTSAPSRTLRRDFLTTLTDRPGSRSPTEPALSTSPARC